MSSTPTCGMAAPKSSGRCVMHAPTSSPPLLPPWMAVRCGVLTIFDFLAFQNAFDLGCP